MPAPQTSAHVGSGFSFMGGQTDAGAYDGNAPGNHFLFGLYGKPQVGDYRLVIYQTVAASGSATANAKYTPIAGSLTQRHHRGGYDVLYANPAGNGQGFNAWGAHSWRWGVGQTNKASLNDEFTKPGNDTRVAVLIVAIRNVHQFPTWPQGHSLGPKVTTANNTLTYDVPGYDDIPSWGRPTMVIHMNVAYFPNKNCYYIGMPANPGMPRYGAQRVIYQSYSGTVDPEAPENIIDHGYSFTVDYDMVPPGQTYYPSQVKAFSGSYIPQFCSTFSILIRGNDAMIGALGPSQLMGGLVPT